MAAAAAAAAAAVAARLHSVLQSNAARRVVCMLEVMFWPLYAAAKAYEYRVVLIWAAYGAFVLYPTEFISYLVDLEHEQSLKWRLRDALRKHTRLAWMHFQLKDFRFLADLQDCVVRNMLAAWSFIFGLVSSIRSLPQFAPPVKVHTESVSSVRDASSIQVDWFYAKNVQEFQVELLDGCVLMLHEGAFGFGTPMTSSFAIGAVIDMCANAGLAIGVAAVRYSFAPESSFPTQLNEATDTFAQYLVDHCGIPADRTVFLGCGAGGNLAIAAGLLLRETGAVMPAGIISVSPWLDLTCDTSLSSPRVAVDTLCDIAKLQAFARRYARELPLRRGLISPVYAELHGLPSQLVCVGSHEVLLDECKKFAHAAKKANSEVELSIAQDCTHLYPFMTLGAGIESLIALHKISAFVVRHVRSAASVLDKAAGDRLAPA